MRDKNTLLQFQSLPLEAKIALTKLRISEWYNYFGGQVCISFSGGKDSTVLTHLVHSMYPEVPVVFANTGLEYPEIQAFARKMGAEFVRPKMSFSEVISTYGYPIIGKEVAEAIHFARRIILPGAEKIVGGGCRSKQDSSESSASDSDRIMCYEQKRTELCGVRNDTERIRRRSEICGGGVQTETLKGRTGWRRANLTDRTPPPKKIGGGLSGQNQTNPPRQKTTHGDRQTGNSGEEKQSPG